LRLRRTAQNRSSLACMQAPRCERLSPEPRPPERLGSQGNRALLAGTRAIPTKNSHGILFHPALENFRQLGSVPAALLALRRLPISLCGARARSFGRHSLLRTCRPAPGQRFGQSIFPPARLVFFPYGSPLGGRCPHRHIPRPEAVPRPSAPPCARADGAPSFADVLLHLNSTSPSTCSKASSPAALAASGPAVRGFLRPGPLRPPIEGAASLTRPAGPILFPSSSHRRSIGSAKPRGQLQAGVGRGPSNRRRRPLVLFLLFSRWGVTTGLVGRGRIEELVGAHRGRAVGAAGSPTEGREARGASNRIARGGQRPLEPGEEANSAPCRTLSARAESSFADPPAFGARDSTGKGPAHAPSSATWGWSGTKLRLKPGPGKGVRSPGTLGACPTQPGSGMTRVIRRASLAISRLVEAESWSFDEQTLDEFRRPLLREIVGPPNDAAASEARRAWELRFATLPASSTRASARDAVVRRPCWTTSTVKRFNELCPRFKIKNCFKI